MIDGGLFNYAHTAQKKYNIKKLQAKLDEVK